MRNFMMCSHFVLVRLDDCPPGRFDTILAEHNILPHRVKRFQISSPRPRVHSQGGVAVYASDTLAADCELDGRISANFG